MIESAAMFGVLGGAVGAVGAVPYLRDTVRRVTVPHRGSWFIWAVLELVAVASQQADGARWSLLPLGAQAVGTVLVFGLALRLGTGGLGRGDLALIAVAGLGIAGWFLVDEPMVATGSAIIADFLGIVMMVPKTWRDPQSETLSMFALAGLGGVLTVASVGSSALPLLAYPVYFALVNGAVAGIIVYRRSSREAVPAAPSPAATSAPGTTAAWW